MKIEIKKLINTLELVKASKEKKDTRVETIEEMVLRMDTFLNLDINMIEI